MADMFFLAGQLLGVFGLAYGAFLTLTYRDQVVERCAERDATVLLQHPAMN